MKTAAGGVHDGHAQFLVLIYLASKISIRCEANRRIGAKKHLAYRISNEIC